MSDIEIFMELIDEKILDYILSEFFSDNNPKQQFAVKKMKLQKLLRDPVSTKMRKKYRTKGNSCLQVLKRELVDKQLLDYDIDNFINAITSDEKNNLSNLELFFTAYAKYPNIIKQYFNDIVHNHREKRFLFKGIDEFNISEDYLDSIELNNLQKDIKLLRKEIEKIKVELNLTKEENNKLNIHIYELNNENKKVKRDIKKYEQDNLKINEEKINLENKIKEKEYLILKKDKLHKDLIDKYKELEKEKNQINSMYAKIKNKEYIELNDDIYHNKYRAALIYTSQILATRSLFKDILFKSYDEYIKDDEGFIKLLNTLNIRDIYIMSNISISELGKLKRKIKKEGMDCKTLLFSSELDMVKELLQDIENNENINLIYA